MDELSEITETYLRGRDRAGGRWRAHIALADAAGVLTTVVEDGADQVLHGYSVQKLAVAVAVMDKVDRGQLALGDRVSVTPDSILPGGCLFLNTVWGDEITVANVLTTMLLISDNTAVRLCGRLVPADEINAILRRLGLARTQVRPVADPNRFLLGTTTPRQTHHLLWGLARRTLLSPDSCDFLLTILRWIGGYHDGVRRDMSSSERGRVAAKYGADHDSLGAARHEVGVMFDATGVPRLTFALFAHGLGEAGNYGGTHPAVQEHAALGRVMLTAVDRHAERHGDWSIRGRGTRDVA